MKNKFTTSEFDAEPSTVYAFMAMLDAYGDARRFLEMLDTMPNTPMAASRWLANKEKGD